MAPMKRSVWIVVGVVVLAGLVLWLAFRGQSENVVVSFVDDFGQAVEKRPVDANIAVSDVTLAGQSKRAIEAPGSSRIAWSVTIPENARLLVSLGVREEAWTTKGDGVVFRISMNDDEVMNMVIDPFGDPSFRKWNDFEIDLTEFAGETVNVFLKTFPSPPGSNDGNGDLAVWGEPRIVTR
jgi:hypothetical protein